MKQGGSWERRLSRVKNEFPDFYETRKFSSLYTRIFVATVQNIGILLAIVLYLGYVWGGLKEARVKELVSVTAPGNPAKQKRSDSRRVLSSCLPKQRSSSINSIIFSQLFDTARHPEECRLVGCGSSRRTPEGGILRVPAVNLKFSLSWLTFCVHSPARHIFVSNDALVQIVNKLG
jgi:hypothetical protein